MQAQTIENQQQPVPVTLRAHTILGVCEAIAEDFGFNPLWLRVPFAASVLVSPTYAIASYLALGLVVLASRLLFPNPKAKAVETPQLVGDAAAVAEPKTELPLAA